jgi:8-oxo-dGTP pyrophosphatase MutT (NUDIX family)
VSDPADESNPWTTLGRRDVYENPWIAVREDRVLRPDGQPGLYGVVHFKNRAIAVLPVDDDGSIWLVGQHRYPVGAYSWEVPEGGGPPDEEPIDTAARELAEETGLIAARLELTRVVHLSNCVSDECGYIFRATGLTRGPSRPEGTERLSVRRAGWADVLHMLREGRITDSLSVVALLDEALRRAGGAASGSGKDHMHTSSKS